MDKDTVVACLIGLTVSVVIASIASGITKHSIAADCENLGAVMIGLEAYECRKKEAEVNHNRRPRPAIKGFKGDKDDLSSWENSRDAKRQYVTVRS